MGLKLEPDEHLVWSSGKGGVVWWTMRVLALLIASGCLVAGAIARDPVVLAGAGLTGSGLAAFITWIVAPPVGRAYFMTTRRLVRENHFGAADAIPLASIQGIVEHELWNQYGQASRTNTIDLKLGEGRILRLRNVADLDGLRRLLQDGVFDRTLDLNSLPALDPAVVKRGAGPPRPERDDLFYADRTFTGGFRWGPMLIGPRRLIRVGGSPRPEIARGISALVDSPAPASEVERRVIDVARQAGDPLVLELSEVALSFADKTLTVRTADRTESIQLRGADAARAGAFLQTHNLLQRS